MMNEYNEITFVDDNELTKEQVSNIVREFMLEGEEQFKAYIKEEKVENQPRSPRLFWMHARPHISEGV